ncbi:MAG: hypothetical protein JWM25_1763, partial [Thermoleophilia bacterium]|nr:hypothetical protein [Thermoleophilia bacterium]
TMADLDALRRVAYGDADIRFNAATGRIALQAVDGVTPGLRIGFLPRSKRDYDAAGIKHSSRLVTFLDVPGVKSSAQVARLCELANDRIATLRTGIGELALSPFKGNDNTGARRRRLDYRQARAVLSQARLDLALEDD